MQDRATDGMNRPRVWLADLTACGLAGLILGVAGPFGSFFNDILLIRLAYWLMVCLMCGLSIGAVVRLVWPPARRRGLAVWIWVPLSAVLLSAPLTAVTRMIAIGFWPGVRGAVGWGEWYGQTLLFTLVYMAIYVAVRTSLTSGPPQEARPEARDDEGPARILDRLPPRLGRDLLCLQMEDHYVRLHTPEGSVLVLSSFGQAIDQIGDIEGLRVHRSWWVARHAVRHVVHDGRKLRLALTSGLEAPVARAKVAQLKAAGWLS